MKPRLKCLLSAAVLLAALPAVVLAGSKDTIRKDLQNQPGLLEAQFLYQKAPFEQCHASTIVETPDGLVAAFFGGKHEKNPDVAIWVCRKPKGADKWAGPFKAAKDSQTAHWNPVLFQVKGGPLLLFYKVGKSPRNWWGMMKKSTDGGKTWSKQQKLGKGPITDIIGPVRSKPVLLDDGRLLCPASTEHDGWRVHFEWTSDWGKTWTQGKVLENSGDLRSIQPTILRYPGSKLQALCRTKSKVMGETWSTDGGKTWSAMTKGPLPNNNAGFDGVTMADGRQFLVYNHTTGGRKVLNLAVSKDGKNWDAAMLLEDKKTYDGSGAYAAYPAAIQAADGKIHIVYTWKRRKINYVAVDPAKFKLRPIKNGKWPD